MMGDCKCRWYPTPSMPAGFHAHLVCRVVKPSCRSRRGAVSATRAKRFSARQLTEDISNDIVIDRSNDVMIDLEEFEYVRKMWKLVAWRIRDAVHGRRISLGSWRPLGPILWAGRDPAGVAVDARRRLEARLRADEGTGDEIGRYLQSERGGDLSGAAATGRRRHGHL